MMGASIEATLEFWVSSLRDVKGRMRPLFTQERVAASAGLFVDGLLSAERRKTGWMRAEAAGDPGPWRQQAILGRGRWDADALRDIVRDYALETLADPEAVLVLDETGFLKQGKASCGVGRQYTGSAGKITNCQIGDRPQKRTAERRRQRPQSLVAIDPLVGPGNPSHRHPPCAKTDQSRPRHCLVRLATRTSSQRSKSSYQTEYATVMLESVREHHAGLHSFRSMRRMEARRRNASALRLRHSQSLANRRQRPSQARVRSPIQRLGRTTKALA